jgi:hypothetical protein
MEAKQNADSAMTRSVRRYFRSLFGNLLGNVHIGGELLPAAVVAAPAQSSGRTGLAESAAVPAERMS